MLDSVRLRLALWHTAVLAVFLGVFALATYLFLQSTTRRRAQEYLDSSAAAFVLDLNAETEDAAFDSAALSSATSEFRVRDLAAIIYDARGSVIAMSSHSVAGAPQLRRRVTPSTRALDVAKLGTAIRSLGSITRPVNVTIPGAGGGYRASITPITFGARSYRVAVVQSRHTEAETLEDARTAYLVAIPIMLIAAGLAGFFLAKRSLAPVAEMSEHAARITAANLDDRLPVVNPRDELGQLANVINALLSRVHTAFDQQRRFMADASHELRTPVAIMRSEADVALAIPERSSDEYREALGVVASTGERLSTIVNELFLLARADAGQQPLRRSTLYLDELIGDCVRSVRALAHQSDVALRVVIDDVDVVFEGDDELLRRLLTNLIENAIKYSGSGATVTISLKDAPDGYRVSVRDTGPGIAPEVQPHVFERFFRADTARSLAVRGADAGGSGAGLGLPIARWIAEAHGGTLNLASSSLAGSEFVLWLPWSPKHVHQAQDED